MGDFLRISILFLVATVSLNNCGRVGTPGFLSALGTKKNSDDPAEDGSNSATVPINVGINSTLKSLALDLATEDLILSKFDITVSGCTTPSHAYYNQIHSDISFAGPSSPGDSVSLPSDDPNCVVSLTRIVIDTDGSAGTATESTYVLDSASINSAFGATGSEAAESVSDRSSGGNLIFTRATSIPSGFSPATPGSGGPLRLAINVTQSNWSNNAAPSYGAKIGYNLYQVVKSDSVIGDVQGTIGFDPPNMPVEIYAINSVTFPSGITDGSYRLIFMCTEATLTDKKCGDIIGNDPGTGDSSNFAICTLPGTVSEAAIETNAFTYCNRSSVSSATTALGKLPANSEEFFGNRAIYKDRLTMVGVPLEASTSRLDTILSTPNQDIWILLYVQAGAKTGIKFWRSSI